MRIAVDARELIGQPTGVGRYLFELLSSWASDLAAADTEIVLHAPARLDILDQVPRRGGATIDQRILPGAAGTRWEQTTLPRAVRDGADVLFCPGYSAPLLAPLPFVVAIHDVSFWAHPEWFRWREGVRRRWTTKLAARRAARVITISQFSRDEILKWLGVPATRIVVTPLAPGRPRGPVASQGSSDTHPRREPLILYVGSLLNRRNLPVLVHAFRSLVDRQPSARLVLVGENRTYPAEDPARLATELGLRDRVDVRSYVPDAELARLYRSASVFAFLSMYEGFGLTPVEAMAAGVPVVAYDTAVAREVYGDAALLVVPGDIEGVATAIERALGDSAERTRLLKAGAETVARLSWDTTARLTLETLEAAARS